jgi:hypothetical protein
VAADLLETIAKLRARWRTHAWRTLSSEEFDVLVDAAESHARLLRLLASMDPRASYRIPAWDALEAVEQEMARERGGKDGG